MIKEKIKISGNHTFLTQDSYESYYNKSIENPSDYWSNIAKQLYWFKNFTNVKNTSFDAKNIYIKWFEGGLTNACYNALDVHLSTKANKTAIIFENDKGNIKEKLTYKELHNKVCKLSNVLKKSGVKKGDVVSIYMPSNIDAVSSMLACARIGAIHSVVFSGFSSNALADRISMCDSKFIITCDMATRGDKILNLKKNVDLSIELVGGDVKKLCFKYSNENNMIQNNDVNLFEEMKNISEICEAEPMDSNDTLFILYTSGSTNKPKGIMHSTGGYGVYVKHTFAINFDYKENELYWPLADIGWITGHSYIVYGPLMNGASIMLYDGLPTYPNANRIWEICEKYEVNILYTSPTLLRNLMKMGWDTPKKYNLNSLRILGSVGEPINVEAWHWYFDLVGQSKTPIVDTWWQTETGGHMIAPIPYIKDMKPSYASMPFFGIKPVILDKNLQHLPNNTEGALCIADSWPGQAIGIYKDYDMFVNTYFAPYPGYYFSGDGAIFDNDGYYKLTGRIDDVLNVSGHLLSTALMESIVDDHTSIAESAIVGIPHDIKGEGICIFIILYDNNKLSIEDIKKDVINNLRNELGALANPDYIQVVNDLPKTRSGKIMRRILRKIASGSSNEIGDISTLSNPESVENIINGFNYKV